MAAYPRLRGCRRDRQSVSKQLPASVWIHRIEFSTGTCLRIYYSVFAHKELKLE